MNNNIFFSNQKLMKREKIGGVYGIGMVGYIPIFPNKKSILYIGKAVDIWRRVMYQHFCLESNRYSTTSPMRNICNYDNLHKFFFVPLYYSDDDKKRTLYEFELIAKYKPRLNSPYSLLTDKEYWKLKKNEENAIILNPDLENLINIKDFKEI